MMTNNSGNASKSPKATKSQISNDISTSIRERGGLKSLTAIRNLPIGKYEAIKAMEM